jgi:hypothetical protein
MKHTSSFLRHWAALAIICSSTTGWAQVPAWQVVAAPNQAVGNSAGTDAMATDAAGNVYTTGSFSGSVSFGGISVNSSNGTCYVAKWSSASRSFAWVKQAEGGFQFGKAIAVSGSSVYLSGTFMGTALFGPTTLTSAGARDVFVAKLSDTGAGADWSWAQRAGGSSDDMGRSLAVQGTSVYLGGSFYSSPASFGSLTLPNAGTNNLDGFVAKLTDAGSTGSFVWAQRMGGMGTEEVRALAVSGGAVYLAGTYLGSAFSFGGASLPASTSSDVFVAKLTDTGVTSGFEWAQSAGGSSYDEAVALAVNGTNVYLAGTFQGPAAFGTTSLAAVGTNSDVFVAKLTDAGSSAGFAWALRAGGASPDVPAGLAVSGSNLYVAGQCSSASADFGSTVLTSAGSSDVFVAKAVDAGNAASWAWAKPAGGPSGDGASALAVRASTVYVAGYVVPVASFDNQSVSGPAPQPGLQPNTVAFLATLTDPTLTATTAGLRPASIGLFPNPAHGRAAVQLPPGTGPATLTVLNALGRTLRTQTATGSQADLDLTGLVPGLYAVRVQAGDAAVTQRLVVE